MSANACVRGGIVLLLAGTAVGCVGKQKQRILMLEDANVRLTERLNVSGSELEAAHQDRDMLARQLQEARSGARSCTEQLTALRKKLSAPRPAPKKEKTAPGWTAVPGGAMIAIEGNVLFAPGRVTLRKDARKALNAVAAAIRSQFAHKDILVLGHTDDRPIKKSGWLDNSQLSTERALAVVRYLRNHHVPPQQLIAGGCGEYRPRIKGTSDANRAANRRVEIFALEPLPRSDKS